VELNPDLAVAHLAQGIVFLRTGKAEQGAEELRQALRLDPLTPAISMWFGEYYSDQKDPVQAEKFYRKAEQLDPNDWNAHQYAGRFFFKNLRYSEAADEWETALRLTPDNAQVLRSLAAAYHSLGRVDEAAAKLQRALEISPSAGVYNNLGMMRFLHGDYAKSTEAFEKAVDINPNDYLYWGNLGDAHRWIPGHERQAKDSYRRAIQIAEEQLKSQQANSDLGSILALYLVKNGEAVRGRERIGELEKQTKRTAASFFRSAIAYEILSDRVRAIRDLKEALRLGFPVSDLNDEPELAALRNDRRYHTLIATASGR
jgi:tetratricopeptide (TPR) repeat protein